MPILGLIGTIVGMEHVFSELDRAENMSAEEVNRGISFALKTTDIGLVVCLLLAVLGTILIKVAKGREATQTPESTSATDHGGATAS